MQIQFALCRFRSPLLTASRLLSFPAGTKMLQFPAFPLPKELCSLLVNIKRSNSDIPGSKVACTSPGHIAACHVLHQLSSLVIHQLALYPSLSLLRRTYIMHAAIAALSIRTLHRREGSIHLLGAS